MGTIDGKMTHRELAFDLFVETDSAPPTEGVLRIAMADRVTIGSHPSNQFVLSDPAIAPFHGTLEFLGARPSASSSNFAGSVDAGDGEPHRRGAQLEGRARRSRDTPHRDKNVTGVSNFTDRRSAASQRKRKELPKTSSSPMPLRSVVRPCRIRQNRWTGPNSRCTSVRR